MKNCPACNRTYADETLALCPADGAVLSAPFDPQTPLEFHASAPATTPQTDEVSSQAPAASAPSEGKPGRKRFTAVGIIFGLSGLLLFGYFVWKADTGEIIRDIRKLGAGFLLVLAISSLRYVVRTLGWTLCFTGEHRLRFQTGRLLQTPQELLTTEADQHE